MFDDVIPCLELLKDCRLGIITNGDSIQQRQKLEQLGIQAYFQTVVVSGDIGVSKPNPEIFIEACKIASVRPEECLFIGDNLAVDILASEKIGMRGIWLNRNNDDSHLRTIRSLSELNSRLESEYRDAIPVV